MKGHGSCSENCKGGGVHGRDVYVEGRALARCRGRGFVYSLNALSWRNSRSGRSRFPVRIYTMRHATDSAFGHVHAAIAKDCVGRIPPCPPSFANAVSKYPPNPAAANTRPQLSLERAVGEEVQLGSQAG